MKVYSLYQNKTLRLIELYSRQKYGEEKSLNYFAKRLNKLILSNNLTKDKTVLFVGVKYPYSDKYKKNFVILTEKISRLTGLPIVYAYYRYKYNSEIFYDNHKVRKAASPKLSPQDKEKYKGYDFIIIEDCVITGTTRKSIEDSIQEVANNLILIAIFDFRKKKVIEKDLNNYYFKKNGVEGLIKLFNKKDYIPTTQMLRTLDLLSKKDLQYLLGSVPDANSLKLSYKIYAERELNL